MSRVLVGARLLAPDLSVPEGPAATVLAQQAGVADAAALLRALADARQGVAAAWAQILGEPLETMT